MGEIQGKVQRIIAAGMIIVSGTCGCGGMETGMLLSDI